MGSDDSAAISGQADGLVSGYRERKDFDLFQEMTRRLNEKDRLIIAQSTEIISKSEEGSRKDARIGVLLDSVPIGVVFVCDRVIEYVNNRVCELTGYSKDELVGRNTRVLYETAEDWDSVGDVQVNATRQPSKVTINWKKKDGSLVECELYMTRVIDECDREFVVLVFPTGE
jgi:PAS domain S-box-containing protein